MAPKCGKSNTHTKSINRRFLEPSWPKMGEGEEGLAPHYWRKMNPQDRFSLFLHCFGGAQKLFTNRSEIKQNSVIPRQRVFNEWNSQKFETSFQSWPTFELFLERATIRKSCPGRHAGLISEVQHSEILLFFKPVVRPTSVLLGNLCSPRKELINVQLTPLCFQKRLDIPSQIGSHVVIFWTTHKIRLLLPGKVKCWSGWANKFKRHQYSEILRI